MVGTGTMCENSGIVLRGVCSSCGHTVVLDKGNCGRIECPHCSRTWARRASERSAARVIGYRQATGTIHKPRHVTIELSSLDWDDAKKRFAAIGATGGVIVLHPWRIKEEFKDQINAEAERLQINRYEVIKKKPNPLSYLEYSPHAHGIVYGRLVDVEKNSNTFVYKNIRRINGIGACEQLMYYLFSHTFIPKTPRSSALRYFGVCSPQKLKPSWTGNESVEVACPICGKPIVYENSNELILVKHYITLGWFVVHPKKKKKRKPDKDPACDEVDGCLGEVDPGMCPLPAGQTVLPAGWLAQPTE